MRNYDADIVTELAAEVARGFWMLELQLDETHYFTDSEIDLMRGVTAAWEDDFDSDTSGDYSLWNMTLGTPAGSVIAAEATSTSPNFRPTDDISAGFDGGTNRWIALRCAMVSGYSGLDGSVQYSTTGHGFSTSYKKDFTYHGNTSQRWQYLDMHDLTAGGSDWETGSITNIKIYLPTGGATDINFDYIGVGAAARYQSSYQFRVSDIRQSANFSIDRVTVEVQNVDQAMSAILLGEDAVNQPAILRYIMLDADHQEIDAPEMFRGFITGWQLTEKRAQLTLGNEFMLWRKKALRLPTESCPWVFTGTECGYSGSKLWCDQSVERCKILGNFDNFGGRQFVLALEDKKIYWAKE